MEQSERDARESMGMDGWMDRLIDGWIDGWINGWMD